MKGLEVGDKLYCHTSVISSDNYFGLTGTVIHFTVGEYYTISKDNQINYDMVMLYTNDVGVNEKFLMRRWFKRNEHEEYYYKKWFYSSADIADMRKLKLNKIDKL